MLELELELVRDGFTLEVALSLPPGPTVLVGPNGAGKSTLLRAILGATPVRRGRIVLEGTTLLDTARGVSLPVEARRVVIEVDAGAPPLNPALRQDAHTLIVGQGANRLTGMMGVRRGKTFIMLEKGHVWPGDAVATILAIPAFNDYKIVADPYTLSTFDKTPIPADRMPRFGCPDQGS